MVDFRRTSWEDANPGFVGAARVGDIFQRILENQKLGIANRYMPGTLQAEMAKKQAEAQYYGPNIENEMALKNAQMQEIYKGRIPHYQAQQRLIDIGRIPNYQAQTELYGAQAGKQGAETIGQKQENEFFNQLFHNPNQAQSTQEPGLSSMEGQKEQISGETPQGNIQQPRIMQEQPRSRQPLNAMPNQQPLQPQPSLTDQMQKYADFQAMKRGQPLPSMETENAVRKEKALLNAKGINEAVEDYASKSKAAAESLPKLRALSSSLSKLPDSLANSWVPEAVKKWSNNPDLMVALKNGANLITGQLRTLFPGRVLVNEMELMKQGTPSPQMPSKAAKEVIQQIELAFGAQHVQNQISQKLKDMVKDRGELDSIMAMAAKNIQPIDDYGTHPERVSLWLKYATPEALNAIRTGINYIPPGIPAKDLSDEALRSLGGK